MLQKVLLYYHTAKEMKSSQLFFTAFNRFRIPHHHPMFVYKINFNRLNRELYFPQLDFQNYTTDQFEASDLLQYKMTLFGESASIDLSREWIVPERSRLWNFHLHYFDWVYFLGKEYHVNDDLKYYKNFKTWVCSWVNAHKNKKGDAWHPNPLSLRIVNWIAAIGMFGDIINNDEFFLDIMVNSLNEQLGYLSVHLEKRLLGNHYLENLKTLLVGSIFFGYQEKVQHYLQLYQTELENQLLEDGFLEERSFQYHHIILAGAIKTLTYIEKFTGQKQVELRNLVHQMAEAMLTIEKNLPRIPFFNDCTINMSAPSSILESAAKQLLDVGIEEKYCLSSAGFYRMESKKAVLLCNCGNILPAHNPGHSHAEMGSFELFYEGYPILVNSGTYTYENSAKRCAYRSTKAHNTVMIDQEEQSECWSAFRVARKGKIFGVTYKPDRIHCGVKTFSGKMFDRSFRFIAHNQLIISDEIVRGEHNARSYWHFHPKVVIQANQEHFDLLLNGEKIATLSFFGAENIWLDEGFYSETFGIEEKNKVYVLEQLSFDKPFGIKVEWQD